MFSNTQQQRLPVYQNLYPGPDENQDRTLNDEILYTQKNSHIHEQPPDNEPYPFSHGFNTRMDEFFGLDFHKHMVKTLGSQCSNDLQSIYEKESNQEGNFIANPNQSTLSLTEAQISKSIFQKQSNIGKLVNLQHIPHDQCTQEGTVNDPTEQEFLSEVHESPHLINISNLWNQPNQYFDRGFVPYTPGHGLGCDGGYTFNIHASHVLTPDSKEGSENTLATKEQNSNGRTSSETLPYVHKDLETQKSDHLPEIHAPQTNSGCEKGIQILNEVMLSPTDMPKFLELEGFLAMGRFTGFSKAVAKFITQAIHDITAARTNMLSKQPIGLGIEGKLDSLIKKRFIRGFFGSLRVLCWYQERGDMKEVFVGGWVFIRSCIEAWVSIITDDPAKSTRDCHDDHDSADKFSKSFILSKVIGTEKSRNYTQKLLFDALKQFTNWARVNLKIPTISFEPDRFKQMCKVVYRERLMYETWLKPSYTTQSNSPLENSSKTHHLAYHGKMFDSVSDEVAVYGGIGKYLISKNPGLKDLIWIQFNKLRVHLENKYSTHIQEKFLNENTNDPEGQSAKMLKETKKGLVVAINAIQNAIIPPFFGIVKTFIDKLGVELILKPFKFTTYDVKFQIHPLILHSLEFIVKKIGWQDLNIQWEKGSLQLVDIHGRERRTLDWSNEEETLKYFMDYGTKYGAPQKFIWYLSRKWQEEIIPYSTPINPVFETEKFVHTKRNRKRKKHVNRDI